MDERVNRVFLAQDENLQFKKEKSLRIMIVKNSLIYIKCYLYRPIFIISSSSEMEYNTEQRQIREIQDRGRGKEKDQGRQIQKRQIPKSEPGKEKVQRGEERPVQK